MRRLGLLLSASALMCVSDAAFSADILTQAPLRYAPAQAVRVPTWSGWYLGGNLGYGFGDATSKVRVPDYVVDSGAPAGVVTVPGFSTKDTSDLNGFVGGVQFGYNWQVAPAWLLGFETDFQRASQKASASNSHNSASVVALPDAGVGLGDCPCDVTGSTSGRYETDLHWFGTLRARTGFIWDRMLFYGTGGFAYGKFQVNGQNTANVTVTDDLGATTFTDSASTSFSKSQWKGGWTIGAGVEGMAWDPRWTWRAEYLYLDFGEFTTRAGAPGGGKTSISTNFTDHVGRLGLNYRF